MSVCLTPVKDMDKSYTDFVDTVMMIRSQRKYVSYHYDFFFKNMTCSDKSMALNVF